MVFKNDVEPKGSVIGRHDKQATADVTAPSHSWSLLF
jgi:hypothetical protein